MTPPPAESPRPPIDEVPTDRHDTAEMPVTKGEMRKSFRANELYTFVVAAVTACTALLGGYKLFISEARAAGEEAAQAAKKKADEVAVEQVEIRQDVRALYRAVMTRQPQERLEQPLPARDGGQ